MIKLLGKFFAYAPPFRYEPPLGGEAYIGGVEGRVPWTADLENQLRKAWDEANAALVTKRFRIRSKKRLDVYYEVKKMLGGWVCTCPARGNCWHIKYAKVMDEVQSQDELDFVMRENDFQGEIC